MKRCILCDRRVWRWQSQGWVVCSDGIDYWHSRCFATSAAGGEEVVIADLFVDVFDGHLDLATGHVTGAWRDRPPVTAPLTQAFRAKLRERPGRW